MTKAKRHPQGNDCLHNAVTDFSTLDPCREDTCFLKKKAVIKEAWSSNSWTFKQIHTPSHYRKVGGGVGWIEPHLLIGSRSTR